MQLGVAQVGEVGVGFASGLAVGPELKLVVVGPHLPIGFEVQHEVVADEIDEAVELNTPDGEANGDFLLQIALTVRGVTFCLMEALSQVEGFLDALLAEAVAVGIELGAIALHSKLMTVMQRLNANHAS